MNPAAAALARLLRAERPTLREIADRLAQADHRASTGKPYAPSVVARMLRGTPRSGKVIAAKGLKISHRLADWLKKANGPT